MPRLVVITGATRRSRGSKVQREMNDNGERFANQLCHKRPGRRREFLPAVKDTQSDSWVSPDLSHVHRKETPRNSSRCACQARVRCGFRPQYPGCRRLKLRLRRNWTERANQRLGCNIFLLNDTNKREEFSITLSQ